MGLLLEGASEKCRQEVVEIRHWGSDWYSRELCYMRTIPVQL